MSNIAIMSHDADEKAGTNDSPRQMLWVDSVGAFLLTLNGRTTIGGPQGTADVSLMANLSRNHATVIRCGDGYLLEAHAAVRVGDRPVLERINLSNGCEIALGENVRLRFSLPSALSSTARLEFLSDHRPSRSIDSIILMDETCLLGPGQENHIQCPEWPESVLLFRRDEEIWCKSRADICVDGISADGPSQLDPGSIVAGVDMRFRIESAEN